MKRIVLCADDYGQTTTISEGILALIDQCRLSATSCIVNTPCWSQAAVKLLPYKDQIDIGLHINFTEGEPLSKQYRTKYGHTFFPLKKLMKLAFLNKLSLPHLMLEAEAQLQAFQFNINGLPNYLDGHQHIHQFPGIREVVVNLYKKYFPDYSAYIRLVQPRLRFSINVDDHINNMKKLVILISGFFFKRALQRAYIPYNLSFAGIYPFGAKTNFRVFFQHYLQELEDNGLLMCHPGLESHINERDSISRARYQEYKYLSSTLFLEDCLKKGVSLQRFDVKKYKF